MKLLIAYGTTEGQTKKICEFLRDEAQKNGHNVILSETTGPHLQPKEFDAAIIAASVHYGQYQASIEHFVQKHNNVLNSIPGIFLSVSLTAASNEPESWEELELVTEEFLNKTGWKPIHVEQVAGALRFSKYNYFKKFIMRMIAMQKGGGTDTSEDYEYTDWGQVKNLLKILEKHTPDAVQTT